MRWVESARIRTLTCPRAQSKKAASSVRCMAANSISSPELRTLPAFEPEPVFDLYVEDGKIYVAAPDDLL